MRNLAHMSVKGRVANAFIRLKDKFGLAESGCINMNISRQDIASFAGTTYETVFRVMNEFSENNIIESDGKNIKINDIDELMKLTKES